MNIAEVKAWRAKYWEGPTEDVYGYPWEMVDEADNIILELLCELETLKASLEDDGK